MKVWRGARYGMVLGLMLITVAACGSDSKDTSSSSTTAAAGEPLVGTQWVLSDSTDLGVPMTGMTVTAMFTADRISGNSGCNGYTGSFAVSGSTVTIGTVAGTRMACEPKANAVETAYLAKLPKANHYKISGKTLTFTNGDGQAILVYEATDPATAIAGKWEVTGLYTGDAISSVVVGSTLTADFDGKGHVSGDSGCNTFNGPYEVSGDTIKLGPFASTLTACVEPEVATQEQQYLAALELAKTFAVAGDRLDLLRADGGIAVVYVKSGS